MLLTTCNDRISRLLSQLEQLNENDSILLKSEQKGGGKVASRATKSYTPLESSAFKPKKLTFNNNSPARQFKLLETAEKKEEAGGFGINISDDNNEQPVGRFSLALHVCMTPKNNDTSIAPGSDDEADGD